MFNLDAQLKEDASKKAFQNFERAQMKATSQANPKEGVTSERFECEYISESTCTWASSRSSLFRADTIYHAIT